MPSPRSVAKKACASLIKGAMALGMLVGLIGIPYLILTEVWDLLIGLFHQHPVWFGVLLVPVIYLAVKVCKWLYQLLGTTMMSVGGIVDRLEKDQE